MKQILEARYTSQFLQDLFLELDYDEQGQLSRRLWLTSCQVDLKNPETLVFSINLRAV